MASEEEEKLNFRETDSAILWAIVRFTQLSSAAGSLTQIQQLSPASLAYLGDAVYELFVRTCYLLPPKRLKDYHHQVVAQVRAETQAKTLQSLKPHLTDNELEVLRRGRNAANSSPRRLAPEIYQQATSLETLLGYLYLTDPHRLLQLLAHLKPDTL
ncbi:MAG: Mini-ribonuclease 3 [Symploca sp. SIO2G7]|nr:Mini-ribonuclease 3 [Symploca sp. SIO2G7]